MRMFTVSTELSLAPYRSAFEQMAMGAVVVPKAIGTPELQQLQKRLVMKSFVPFQRADLGRFAFVDRIDEPELTEGLCKLAAFVTETNLNLTSERCYRLRRGDYVLSKGLDDGTSWDEGARLIDVIADLSESSSGEAQVVYAHKGEHFFAAPQLSRSISVIERRPSVTRYHRYLNHKVEERVIYRYCITLARSDVAPTDPPSRRP